MLASRRLALYAALSRTNHNICNEFVAPAPRILERPTVAAPYANDAAAVEWERVQLQVEPGELGRVVLVIAKPIGSVSAPRPAVIVVHSTGSTKETVADHLQRYASKGFISVAFDTRYHGERALFNAGLSDSFSLNVSSLGSDLVTAIMELRPQRDRVYQDALVKAWKTGEERPFIFDTVSDAFHVVDYLVSRPDVDSRRIGATGISLGGMVTWLLAAADERIAAVAPAIGVQSFRYAVEQNLWEARVNTIKPVFVEAANDMGKSEVDTEVVAAVWQRILPGMLDGDFDAELSLQCIAPRPLLIASGEADPRCCIDGLRDAIKTAMAEYKAQGAPHAIRHFVDIGVEHTMTKNMWDEIDAFFDKHLLLAFSSSARLPPDAGSLTASVQTVTTVPPGGYAAESRQPAYNISRERFQQILQGQPLSNAEISQLTVQTQVVSVSNSVLSMGSSSTFSAYGIGAAVASTAGSDGLPEASAPTTTNAPLAAATASTKKKRATSKKRPRGCC